jgi:large subunit ribosomal protein L21
MLPLSSAGVQTAIQPLLTGPLFAVVWVTNLQYKVAPGDVFAVQRIRADVGATISLKKVCMVGGERFTAIGRPFLENCRVVCDVEEAKRMKNVVSLFHPRGRRVIDWRDSYHAATILRVKEVQYDPEVVGEVSKFEGNLLAADFEAMQKAQGVESTVSESPNAAYWSRDGDAALLDDAASSYPRGGTQAWMRRR